MTSCLNFSAASAHSCTIHSCSYKPADTGESCRSSRSSHGGDSNCGNSRIHSIKTVSGDSVYHELLRKFPDITKPPRPDQEIKHSVVHYIENK
ncbi:hypothetical protein TNCV_4979381 [Trichonephila clavipes]|nr:hypothetical protein TNCV_4979381 [Trichonephila clavipes]